MTAPLPVPGNVVLEGYINVPSDRLEAVSTALGRHIELTRAEPGCLYFDVAADPAIAGRFNVYEIFAGRDAFDFHQKRAGASAWAKTSAGIERHYVVTNIEA